MKMHKGFFSLRKIEKIAKRNLTTNKYSQLQTFISKKPFNSQNIIKSNRSKENSNKRYYLNSNRIPNLKQSNIKSFSIANQIIKLDNAFNKSNSNFYSTNSSIKNGNINTFKSLNLNNNLTHDNNMRYTSKTIHKNKTVYQIRESNREHFSKPKSNLKKIKLIDDFNNMLSIQNNLNNHFSTIKRDIHKTNNFKNRNIIKPKKDFTIKGLLNEKYSNYPEARHSANSFDVISSYGVNTYKGIVRNYNEDRVSIIVNAKMPKNFNPDKNNAWPNVSFFGIFDGHAGNKCAEYLKTNLHYYILNSPFFPSNPVKAIQNGFQLCENNFINSIYNEPFNQYLDYSGSCAIEIIIINNQCYIANLGDSRAIYSYNSGNEFYQLSRDHKPNDIKEKKRIYKAGGSIFKTNLAQFGMPFTIKESELGFKIPYRINPGRLAVSKYLII